MDVDRVQLPVRSLVGAGSDSDEADDPPLALRHERGRPGSPPSRMVFDGHRLQLVAGKGVGVCGLPRLDVDTSNSGCVTGCPGANHAAEPTLPPESGSTSGLGRSFYADFYCK